MLETRRREGERRREERQIELEGETGMGGCFGDRGLALGTGFLPSPPRLHARAPGVQGCRSGRLFPKPPRLPGELGARAGFDGIC